MVKPDSSLKVVVPVLEELLQQQVIFLNDCVGNEVEEAVLQAKNGQIVLLENLRFHVEEEGAGIDAAGKKAFFSFRSRLTLKKLKSSGNR